MYPNFEQRSSVQTQYMDLCISDDDDVVDPHNPVMPPIRHSSPANLAHMYKSSQQEIENSPLDKSMTSSFSSSTFSSSASKRDSIYSIARSSTVASSINEQAVANVDTENRKRWSGGSWSSQDESTMSPQKMSLTHLKTATAACPIVTKVTADPAMHPDVRRSPAPNPSIMSVLSPRNESEMPISPVRYNTPAPHPLDHQTRDEFHHQAYAPSTTDSITSRGTNGRMSWSTNFNMPETFSGWLLKHNATHFTFTTPWKRFFYVLSEHALHEYKSDKPDSPLREQFDFTKDTLVFLNEGFPGKPFVVEIRKPGQRMCLQCTDLDTMKQWMNHLKKSIAQVRRNEYLKAVEEGTHTKPTTPPHTTDIKVVHNSSNINEGVKDNTESVNHTPINPSGVKVSSVRYRSKSDQSCNSSSSHGSKKSLAIPPQLPPPSHSPPPIPNV